MMTENNKSRENQYDLLRLVSMIAVIMIHTAGIYVGRLGEIEIHGMRALSRMDTVSTFAVPCFVMLSGAFTLGEERNADAGIYYKKIIKKIGVPALAFTVIYTLLSIPQAYMGSSRGSVTQVLYQTFCGLPYYHMWYVFMMIWIYVLTPFVVRLRKRMGARGFAGLAVLLFCICGIGFQIEHHTVLWDPRYSLCFMGYYMAGCVLRDAASRIAHRMSYKGRNILGVIWIAAGFSVLALQSSLRYRQMIGEFDETKVLVGSSAPAVMAASVMLFFGFSLLAVKRDCSKLIRGSYLIYLIHGGALTFVTGLIYLAGATETLLEMNVSVSVPLITAIIFAISYFSSQILMKFADFLRFIRNKEK